MTSKSRRGPRGDISAALLLDAAERVLAEAGVAGLSLRRVAREAGIAPNAVYTYFDDMADLSTALADSFLSRLDLTQLTVGGPEDALRGLLKSAMRLFTDSPHHVALLAAQRVAGPNAMNLNEALLDFFIERVGVETDLAVVSTGFITEWIHGYAALAPTDAPTPAFERALSRLDLTRWPRTVDMLGRQDQRISVDLLVRAVIPGH